MWSKKLLDLSGKENIVLQIESGLIVILKSMCKMHWCKTHVVCILAAVAIQVILGIGFAEVGFWRFQIPRAKFHF